MSTVHLIADPWTNPSETMRMRHGATWSKEYKLFRARLHWLLLWYDEVRIVDSFWLFNRQLEHWLMSAHVDNTTGNHKALLELFDNGVITVPIRKQPDQTFGSLLDVDLAQVRHNPNFIWYYDGRPEESFVRLLDQYLHLPNESRLITYEGRRRPEQIRDAFHKILEFHQDHEGIYERFSVLREQLPHDLIRTLTNMDVEQWTRSGFYTKLGHGLDGNLRSTKDGAEFGHLSPGLRKTLREFADWSFYLGLHRTIDFRTRFPGDHQLSEVAQIYPSLASPELGNDDPLAADELMQHRGPMGAPRIVFEGDVDELLIRFADLELHTIQRLRNQPEFVSYRDSMNALEMPGSQKLNDRKFRLEILRLSYECLRAIGASCDVSLAQSASGQRALQFLGDRTTTAMIIWGVALMSLGVQMHLPPAIFLSNVILRVARSVADDGSKKRPAKAVVKAKARGGIQTPK